MDGFPTSLRPLDGGSSGETFLADAAGEQVVVRVYGGRSARRGPLAPEVDAAVLELVRGLLPVPDVLEVRRGDPENDLPGLLVTSRLAGERLDLLLPTLTDDRRAVVGAHLGTLVGRLGHMVQPRAGRFTDRTLVPEPFPAHRRELLAWLEHHEQHLGAELVEGLRPVAEDAQDLLDEDHRVCLVHAGLDHTNLLVDADTLEVTGLVDWELAHSGSPYADLGNLLRFERDPVLSDAVLSSYRAFMPVTPDDLLERAHAADLFAVVDLAARPQENGEEDPVVTRAHALLVELAG